MKYKPNSEEAYKKDLTARKTGIGKKIAYATGGLLFLAYVAVSAFGPRMKPNYIDADLSGITEQFNSNKTTEQIETPVMSWGWKGDPKLLERIISEKNQQHTGGSK